MISEQRMEKALRYLAETDEPCAKAKSHMKGLEYGLKTARALGFSEAEGPIGEREHRAYMTDLWREMVDSYKNAVADYETMANKRKTEELIVEVWRSVNANQRRGNV